MLKRLYVKDFVIVDELDLDFSAGYSVFTGETGAGKSILIDALSLAERAHFMTLSKMLGDRKFSFMNNICNALKMIFG